jgi:hypothetical protein
MKVICAWCHQEKVRIELLISTEKVDDTVLLRIDQVSQ